MWCCTFKSHIAAAESHLGSILGIHIGWESHLGAILEVILLGHVLVIILVTMK